MFFSGDERSCWKFPQNIFHRGRFLSQKKLEETDGFVGFAPWDFSRNFVLLREAGLFGAPIRSNDTEMFEVTVIPEMCCELD